VTTRAAVSRSGLTSSGDEKKIVTVLSKPESYVNKAATGVIVQNSTLAMAVSLPQQGRCRANLREARIRHDAGVFLRGSGAYP
jgi:hypothetical protein